jgi:signal transduction histidine kinase
MNSKPSPTFELASRVDQLTRLIEVSKSVAAQLDLEPLLQQIVNTATSLLNAEMGGLLVLSIDEKSFQYFKVSGWPYEPRGMPSGKGLLSMPFKLGIPLRIDDVGSHPKAKGLPDGHPRIRAFLSVPLMRGDHALGSLFIGNAPEGRNFINEDEELLMAFAAQATIAIENARLYAQAEELARIRERQRIAQDLHDMVAQMLFTIGLEADWCVNNLALDASDQKHIQMIRRLSSRSSDELRSAIFALRSPYPAQGESLIGLLQAQIKEFQAQSGADATLIMAPGFPSLPALLNEAIYRIVRESLSNVNKHANASGVLVSLTFDNESVTIMVLDNGVGLSNLIDPNAGDDSLHFGVVSMRKLAEQARGVLKIANNDDLGTRVWARFPLPGESL